MENKRVTLVGHYGSDESIALAAWTSTSRELTEDKKNRIPQMIQQRTTRLTFHAYNRLAHNHVVKSCCHEGNAQILQRNVPQRGS